MKPRAETVTVGDVFNRWTVVSFSGRDPHGRRRWNCRCSCGTIGTALEDNLKRGATKSCGCLSSETTTKRNKTHGLSSEPLYCLWNNAMQRCYNPRNASYKDYGARGITVHPAWHDYTVFRQEVPTMLEGLTLDREDNDRGYEPGNVRWVTQSQQMVNRRCTVKVAEFTDAKDLIALADRLDVPYGTARGRYQTLKALGLPVGLLIAAPRKEYTRATRTARKQISNNNNSKGKL